MTASASPEQPAPTPKPDLEAKARAEQVWHAFDDSALSPDEFFIRWVFVPASFGPHTRTDLMERAPWSVFGDLRPAGFNIGGAKPRIYSDAFLMLGDSGQLYVAEDGAVGATMTQHDDPIPLDAVATEIERSLGVAVKAHGEVDGVVLAGLGNTGSRGFIDTRHGFFPSQRPLGTNWRYMATLRLSEDGIRAFRD